jgi:hypothetical protein
MRTNEIKKGVYASFATARMADKVDEQILSCIIYDVVRRVLASDESQQNDVRSIAENYLPGLTRKFQEFKSSFVSYSRMRSEVESFNRSTFLGYTQQEIAKINKLYQERVEVKPFSSLYFSQYMYRISDLKEPDYRRLSGVHRSLMSPIARFYTDQYSKSDSDLEVLDAESYGGKPGKEIVFSVKGIEPSRVVSDIRTGRIPVSGRYSSIEVDGKYVRVVAS